MQEEDTGLKKAFIKDLKEKDHVESSFLVTKKESGVSKAGKAYLALRLMDSTGELEARVWDDAEEASKLFSKDDVAEVRGYAVAYQGGLQINVSSIWAAKEGEYSMRDFLPSSRRPPEEMLAELDCVVSAVKDRHIRALLQSIFSDDEMRWRFMTAPAAKAMHHPYLGGLIEHVLSICGLVEKVAAHYGEAVNKDLLTAGAILHDIGKTTELSYARSFDYTDEGRLIGHITIGVEIIERHARGIDGFPQELSMFLKHMVLSHHGQLEFGSPKRPKTLEALILSFLDDMDAKVNSVLALREDARESAPGWSPFQRIFERYIYKGTYRGEDGGSAVEDDIGAQAKKPGKGGDEPPGAKPGNMSLFK